MAATDDVPQPVNGADLAEDRAPFTDPAADPVAEDPGDDRDDNLDAEDDTVGHDKAAADADDGEAGRRGSAIANVTGVTYANAISETIGHLIPKRFQGLLVPAALVVLVIVMLVLYIRLG